ncbi:MAG: acetolactate synthase large subunit [Campylobacteraceae bacterium]|jgi:acetolactate synthase-1/2/3 large subunit|nr:acetolactate synthase large subunit [Campylobacteraceae bacterium]MBT4030670.1 acetolactate synthase large subunit [Campylobacteraceae bacterium]MBT4178717.1 acetolactate synthase large subunit [Campylobacteraceae bacterium]MBT4571904.1 acetolactate synthase large subunit [Campylobacteraceae bacterium]MBT5323687.1 acetolactate synthase large subunit [Campylobacteraceae bacterium]
MMMTGSQMVTEAIAKENVNVVYGYPGGAIMNVYDEIYKQNNFQHILTKHEQAAVHAADAHARSTGEVGVAIVTSGPGFTNAVTGLATAYTDSIPMVVISGQVPTAVIGTDAFQEIDAVGISRSCTKHNFLVNDVKDLTRVLKIAFHIARTGRPGPVHIDIPKDVTAEMADFDYTKEFDLPTYKPTTKGNLRQIKNALDHISKAKRPLLYVGGGAVLSNCYEDIREFAHLTKIPVVETLMARGIMRSDDELLFGMLGMHGEYAANMAMSETDMIICLGARFDDRVTGRLDVFAKKAHVVHVDIDPASIAKIVKPNYPIVGDLGIVMKQILEHAREFDFNDYSDWVNTLDTYQKEEPLRFIENEEGGRLKPQWAIQRTGELLGDDALISTDVGQHQMWAAQFYPFNYPRQFMTSGGLGTMGVGLPYAMGVKRANPEKVSINFTGDGSVMMNIQEIITCTQYGLPIINIILNNNYLGMVRQWQTRFYEDRLSETILETQADFKMLCESMGGVGFKVNTKEEFDQALKDAVASNKPAIIEVIVDRREEVIPMVPNGHALNEMLLLEGDK